MELKSRKYCSSLQAVFWLAQDASMHQAQLSIRFYNLAALLDHAWLHEFNSITNEDLKSVIRAVASGQKTASLIK